MTARLLVSAANLGAGPLQITGDDHHYLFRVRRLTVGSVLTLFDGAGRSAPATVTSIDSDQATLEVGQPIHAESDSLMVTVLLPLIKGERMDRCITQLCELGVSSICLYRAERAVVDLSQERAMSRRERYVRLAEAAARQSRRVSLPTVTLPLPLSEAITTASDHQLKLMLAEDCPQRPMKNALPSSATRVAILSGPEGSLTDNERRQATDAGFIPVGLGPQILRAETAPVAALAIVSHLLGTDVH